MEYGLEVGDVRTVVHGDDAERTAVVLPGQGYHADMPLLYYTRRLLLDRGWLVREIWWRPPQSYRPPSPDDAVAWASDQGAAAVRQAGSPEQLLVVGKSLGSLAIPATLDAGAYGVWLTPLLREPSVAGVLDALDERHLLVGSLSDRSWDAELAAGTGALVYELAGADHGLELPTVQDTLTNLVGVLARISSFVDGLD